MEICRWIRFGRDQLTVSGKAPVWVGLMFGVIGSSMLASTAGAQDTIPKFVLIKMTLDQTSTLCASPTFTQCMEFSETRCNELANMAVEQCLAPLPDQIDPKLLQNESLEQCPQEIYTKEGLSEEKARGCFELAMDAEASESTEPASPEKSTD